jgi:hypothetical protein
MPMVPNSDNFSATLDGNADSQSPWIYCKPFHLVSFELSWALVAATAGEFFLEGNNDPSQAAASVVRFDNAAMSWFFNGALALPRPVAAAGTAFLAIENPMWWHRIVYVFGAGGAANQFALDAILRAT